MSVSSIWLIRHGRYNQGTGALTPDGIEAAEYAGERLADMNLSNPILLSSTARRAFETADIIGEAIKASVITSKDIENGGNTPILVPNLDNLFATVLNNAGVEAQEDSSLLVVTHAPMLAKALGHDHYDAIRYGQIVEYTAGTWDRRA